MSGGREKQQEISKTLLCLFHLGAFYHAEEAIIHHMNPLVIRIFTELSSAHWSRITVLSMKVYRENEEIKLVTYRKVYFKKLQK